MKLSILIPTLPEQQSQVYFTRLLNILKPQITEDVEIVVNDSPRSMPTGTKRNWLIDNSSGEYFCQIDCDDIVPMFYVNELLKAIEQGPDVITFNGYMTTDGKHRRDFTIKLGEKYEERNGKYFRYPNHLCCYKRSVVKHVKFQPIWVEEDYRWATEIKNKGLLKSSIHIESDMYHYDFVNKNNKHYQNIIVRRTTLR